MGINIVTNMFTIRKFGINREMGSIYLIWIGSSIITIYFTMFKILKIPNLWCRGYLFIAHSSQGLKTPLPYSTESIEYIIIE